MARVLAFLVVVAAVASSGGGSSASDNSLSVGVEDCYFVKVTLPPNVPPYVSEVRVCPRA